MIASVTIGEVPVITFLRPRPHGVAAESETGGGAAVADPTAFHGAGFAASVAILSIAVIARLRTGDKPVAADGRAGGRVVEVTDPADLNAAECGAAVPTHPVPVIALLISESESVAANRLADGRTSRNTLPTFLGAAGCGAAVIVPRRILTIVTLLSRIEASVPAGVGTDRGSIDADETEIDHARGAAIPVYTISVIALLGAGDAPVAAECGRI